MTEHLAMLAAWCGPDGGGLFLGLFFAGLAGGPLHCAPMCGPFVLGQAADRLARVPAARLCEMSRLDAAILAPYHLGRLTTYAVLGSAAGLLARLPGVGRFAGVMLLAGALLFLMQAVRSLAPALTPALTRFLGALRPATRTPAFLVRTITASTRHIDRTRWTGGLLLGLALGFLPCGFLYAALAVSAATASPARGALAMLAFGLGTVPTLVAVGLAGQAGGRIWQRRVRTAAPALMFLNAAVLATAAWQSLIGSS